MINWTVLLIQESGDERKGEQCLVVAGILWALQELLLFPL